MVEIDIREGPRQLHIPSPPKLTSFRSLFFNRGATARLVIHIAQVEPAVMPLLRSMNCAFYVVNDGFVLDGILTIRESILMYLLHASSADIDNLGVLNIVRGTWSDDFMSIVAFARVEDLD